MATKTGVGVWVAPRAHKKTWTLLNGDVGTDLSAPGLPMKTVTVQGTMGSGGSVSILGGDDGTNYSPLNDIFGNPLVFTAAGSKRIAEANIALIHPSCTAGDGTTSIVVQVDSVG